MRRLNTHAPRIAGLLALMLGAVALLAVSGVAAAKDRAGDDHGHHGRHHHHHHRNFEMREAGTISSFEASTDKLTITLLGGGTVAGLVTDGTKIKCEGVDHRSGRRDHGSGGGNSGSGDDNGGHAEPGDDNGGRGETEPGDDKGGRGETEPGDDHGGETPPVGTPAGGASCSVASLVNGAAVSEAELRSEGGSATFVEIELGHDS